MNGQNHATDARASEGQLGAMAIAMCSDRSRSNGMYKGIVIGGCVLMLFILLVMGVVLVIRQYSGSGHSVKSTVSASEELSIRGGCCSQCNQGQPCAGQQLPKQIYVPLNVNCA